MNYERQSATIYTAGPWHQRIWVIYADALCSCGLAVCKGIRRFRIRRRAFYSLREKMYTRRQKTPAGPAASALDTGKRVKSRSGSLSRTEPPSRIHFFNGLCAGRRHTRFFFSEKNCSLLFQHATAYTGRPIVQIDYVLGPVVYAAAVHNSPAGSFFYGERR